MTGVIKINISFNKIKEMITYFKDTKQKSEKKKYNYKTPSHY